MDAKVKGFSDKILVSVSDAIDAHFDFKNWNAGGFKSGNAALGILDRFEPEMREHLNTTQLTALKKQLTKLVVVNYGNAVLHLGSSRYYNCMASTLGRFVGAMKARGLSIAGALAIGTYMFSKDSKPPQA